MIKGSKILITGGCGSLGRTLAQELSKDNEVVVYDEDKNELCRCSWL